MIWASTAALAAVLTSAQAGPPAPSTLFGCPLAGVEQPKRGAKTARAPRILTQVRLAVELPGALQIKAMAPQRVDLAARRRTLSLRRSHRAPAGGLDEAKAAMERYELRRSHISRSCERAALARILPATSTTFRRARLGVHSRPLGQRRRTYALYLEAVDHTVVLAVVTVTWPRSHEGPSLKEVSALLRGVASATDSGALETPSRVE